MVSHSPAVLFSGPGALSYQSAVHSIVNFSVSQDSCPYVAYSMCLSFDMLLMLIPSSKCMNTLVALQGTPDHLLIVLSVRVSRILRCV